MNGSEEDVVDKVEEEQKHEDSGGEDTISEEESEDEEHEENLQKELERRTAVELRLSERKETEEEKH